MRLGPVGFLRQRPGLLLGPDGAHELLPPHHRPVFFDSHAFTTAIAIAQKTSDFRKPCRGGGAGGGGGTRLAGGGSSS
jgi:hypothetical protein